MWASLTMTNTQPGFPSHCTSNPYSAADAASWAALPGPAEIQAGHRCIKGSKNTQFHASGWRPVSGSPRHGIAGEVDQRTWGLPGTNRIDHEQCVEVLEIVEHFHAAGAAVEDRDLWRQRVGQRQPLDRPHTGPNSPRLKRCANVSEIARESLRSNARYPLANNNQWDHCYAATTIFT